MAEKVFSILNCAAPTTAATVAQPTGTAIRTMLQIKAGSTKELTIIEWGISFDGSAAATPINVELFETSVAATMSTAHSSSDVYRLNVPTGEASLIDVSGTTASGFATGAVTEGTVANYRSFDSQLIAPTNQYVKQWPLGREPVVQVSKFLRVRVTAGASVGCKIYVNWAE